MRANGNGLVESTPGLCRNNRSVPLTRGVCPLAARTSSGWRDVIAAFPCQTSNPYRIHRTFHCYSWGKSFIFFIPGGANELILFHPDGQLR